MSLALEQMSSDACLARYADLEAIDFFLARELQAQLGGDQPLRFPLWLALHWALRQGHSCLDLRAIADRTLWAEDGRADSAPKPGHRFPALPALQALLDDLELTPESGQTVVRDADRLYLRRYWRFEQELLDQLAHRLTPVQLSLSQQELAAAVIRQLFPHCPAAQSERAAEQNSDHIDWQAVAVANAVRRRFCILSGGPGTGKTYTVTRLLATLQAVAGGSLRIMMAAPTGKAKQRLQESIAAAKRQLARSGFDAALLSAIPETAHTLHGLLGVRPNSLSLRHQGDNPLPVNLLLIDEASMVDLPMMTRVLRALPADARLVLVGDANQLPSIAVGSVLSDLAPLPHVGYSDGATAEIEQLCGYQVPLAEPTQATHDHVSLLRHSHRFDGKGGIGQLAQATISLEGGSGWQLLQAAICCDLEDDVEELGYVAPIALDSWLEAAVNHYYRGIAAAPDLATAFARLAAFRVLVPTRVGEWGVEALNQRIEAQLARVRASIRPGHHYHGRPVMITRNHHDLGVFNGDVGLVWHNDQGQPEACFEQADGIRRINLGLLPETEPVYAMTIHKTQGSEFGHVALLLPDQAARLLSPELIYTGITRAKQRCVVSVSESTWRSALSHRADRWSGLRLKG